MGWEHATSGRLSLFSNSTPKSDAIILGGESEATVVEMVASRKI